MWGLSLEGRANAGQILCINSYLKSDDWLRSSTSSRSLRIRMHHVVWVLEIITPSWLSEVVPSHFAFSHSHSCGSYDIACKFRLPVSFRRKISNLYVWCESSRHVPFAILLCGWWRLVGGGTKVLMLGTHVDIVLMAGRCYCTPS